MTVSEMADRLHVSKSTIYRRLKAHNVDVDALRDPDGHLNTDGMNVIAALFDATASDVARDDAATSRATSHETHADTPDPATTIAVLSAKLDAAAETIQRLEDVNADLRKQLAAAMAALEREQNDRQHERLLLADPTASGRHVSIFQRLFKRG